MKKSGKEQTGQASRGKAAGFLLAFFWIFFEISTGTTNPVAENEISLQLPEKPLSGSQVFIEKGCIRCHTVWGFGERFGPDLSRVGRTMDFFDLAGGLWSHSPRMIEVMEEKGVARPTLTAEETEKLLTYLYFLGFFEDPGDYGRGEKIYAEKQCGRCHSLGGGKGVPLDKFGIYISPVFMAAELWNHAAAISPSMGASPFAPGEMSHLLAYIRGQALNPKAETRYILPGNPLEGRKVFQRKNCFTCHGANGERLKKDVLRKGLTEIVGLMWNHSYPMWQEIRQKGLDIPRFEPEEMANLLTFLYFLQFYGERGDPRRGEEIFTKKGCINCHGQRPPGKKLGLDLKIVAGLSASELISRLWNHVPQMERMVTELNLVWPRFESGEIKDLIYYIKSLQK